MSLLYVHTCVLCHKGTQSLTRLLRQALLFLSSPWSNVSDYHRDHLAWLLQPPSTRQEGPAFWDVSFRCVILKTNESLLKGIITTLSSAVRSALYLAVMLKITMEKQDAECRIGIPMRQFTMATIPRTQRTRSMLHGVPGFPELLKVNVGINLVKICFFLIRSNLLFTKRPNSRRYLVSSYW
jgi:hypothetical protein